MRFCNDLARGVQNVPPDRLRIMLDPSRLRIGLRKLTLRRGEQPPRRVEEEAPRRGRALINCKEMGLARHWGARPSGCGRPHKRSQPRFDPWTSASGVSISATKCPLA